MDHITLPSTWRYECPTDPQHFSFTVTDEGSKLADEQGFRCNKCHARLQKVFIATGDVVLGELTYEDD